MYPPRSRMSVKEIEKHAPNRFAYAVSEGMIGPQEVPEYAGLIYINMKAATARWIKGAPLMHKSKVDYSKRLLDKFYYNYMNLKAKVRYAKMYKNGKL